MPSGVNYVALTILLLLFAFAIFYRKLLGWTRTFTGEKLLSGSYMKRVSIFCAAISITLTLFVWLFQMLVSGGGSAIYVANYAAALNNMTRLADHFAIFAVAAAILSLKE